MFQFGLVSKSPRDPDEDETDSDDELDEVKVPRGKVRVSWYPDTEEQVVREDRVTLADRSLMPGDVVKRNNGQKVKTQSGICQKVRVKADLKIIATDNIVTEIETSRLDPMHKFLPETGICYSGWVGRIKRVNMNFWLQKLSSENPDDKIRVFDQDQILMIENEDDVFEPDFDPMDYYIGLVMNCPKKYWYRGQGHGGRKAAWSKWRKGGYYKVKLLEMKVRTRK